ncbi:unnamed protein product [Parajaminaea phylloscopi]
MFWRFGFASTSTLDTLLDKQGFTVEELLDEDDLLQECKAQNGKLVDFLSQTRVIKRLFEHVVGVADVSGPGGSQWEEKVRFKYPYVASEVLSSDIHAIVEAALKHPEELLDPFWNAVLHTKPSHVQPPLPHHSHPLLAGSPSSSPIPPPSFPPPSPHELGTALSELKSGAGHSDVSSNYGGLGRGGDASGSASGGTSCSASDPGGAVLIRALDNGPGKSVLAGYWAKVNGVFLDKKPKEMLAYIRQLPRITQRFVAHLETPAVVDLLYRIISCEQTLPNAGVIEWLSSEELVPQVVELLSPSHSVDLHNTVSELLKAIIALSAPSPAGMGAGAQDSLGYGGGSVFGQPEQPVGVLNKLVRELASEPVVRRLVSFMLDSKIQAPTKRRPSEARSDVDESSLLDEDSDEEAESLSFKTRTKKNSTRAGLSVLSTLNEDSALDDTEDADDTDPQPLNPSLTPAFELSSKAPGHRDSTATLRPTDFFPPVEAPKCAVTPETRSSSLVTGIGILIELIRKNNSDYFEQHLFHALRAHLIARQQEITTTRDQARQEGLLTDDPKDDEDDDMEGMEEAMAEMTDKLGIVHLGPMLQVLCERLDEFQELIGRPISEDQMLTTTLGPVRPLTFERYRITELYAELLHCSNMALLNRAPEEGPQYSKDGILQGGIDGLQILARTLQGVEADESISVGPGGESFPMGSTSREDLSGVDGKGKGEEAPSGHHTRQHSSVGEDSLDSSNSDPFGDDSAEEPVATEAEPAKTPEEEEEDAKSIRSALSSMSLADLTSPHPSEPPSPSLGNSDASAQPHVVGDLLKQRFLDVGIMPSILNLFFDYPWNNFLHNVIYDILQQCFNGRMNAGLNRRLTVAVFNDGHLPEKVLEGHRLNEQSMDGPRRIRLGYMGHMNLIAEETVKLFEKYPQDIGETVHGSIPQPQWDTFVKETLRENREREAAPLAGGRPALPGQFGRFGAGDMGDEDGDAAVVGQTGDGGQFASYLSSQMSGNTSDDDDDSDEEANWLAASATHHAGGGSGGFEDVFEPSGGSGPGAAAARANADDDDDDEWGPFGSTSGNYVSTTQSADDGFGDFQSSASQPLTAADWAASSFNESQAEDSIRRRHSGEGDADEEGEHGGSQNGDDTPPQSPTSDDYHTPFVDLSDVNSYRNIGSANATHRRSSSSSSSDAAASAGIAQFRQQAGMAASGATPGGPTATSANWQRRRSSSSNGSTGSTDPSAAQAVIEEEPLGPGVPSDAQVKDGMIERTLQDGTVVTVPLDDVALAVGGASGEDTAVEGSDETGGQ